MEFEIVKKMKGKGIKYLEHLEWVQKSVVKSFLIYRKGKLQNIVRYSHDIISYFMYQ